MIKLVAKIKNSTEQRTGREGSPFPKAFPSDTYIEDLSKSVKTDKVWVKWLPWVIALTVLADFYLLQDAFAWMLETASLADVAAFILPFLDKAEYVTDAMIVQAFFSLFVCVALIAVYLTFCSLAGRKLAEYRAFRGGKCLGSCLFYLAAVLTILAFITIVRYCSILDEASASSTTSTFSGFGASGSSDSGFGFGGSFGSEAIGGSLDLRFDELAFVQTLGLVAVMFAGALLEILHAYYAIDPYAVEKKRLAQAYVAEDRLLYDQTFARLAVDGQRARAYEEQERRLDSRTINTAFRLSELAAQLNGIVDPADAQDFSEASRLIKEDGTPSLKGAC
ncbi:MAG: hypothetical protein HFJ72_05985 [Adlercreutzia sp.]|nr:hypothetical protein [Adlercreutzia sp.]